MIVGTAGHIDHGKTALVRALTGIDTDRLKEEKARGISIDLGFAYMPIGDDEALGFIDVPGHERFVHNMLAGASSIDFVLLTVAADDGVMPQTREHLAIVDLLGIGHGAVALTKIDLVDVTRRRETAAEIRLVLEETWLGGLPILSVSATTGEGIDDLRTHLVEASHAIGKRPASGCFRLAVDRVFTLTGAGTVVTGTVLSGAVAVGDHVTVSPAGLDARVRAIRAQNKPVDIGRAGDRCGLNLVGDDISKDALSRGDIVLDPTLHAPADHIDATLHVLTAEPKPIGQWFPVRLHHAACEVGAHIVLLSDPINPGASDNVQLVLEKPVAAAAGDRYVVRDISAQRTIGGGRFLDLRGPARKRRSPARCAQLAAHALVDPDKAVAALLETPPFFLDLTAFGRDRTLATGEMAKLADRIGLVQISVAETIFAVSANRWLSFKRTLLSTVDAFHTDNPDLPGLSRERLRLQLQPRLPPSVFAVALRSLARAGEVALDYGWVRLAGFAVHLTPSDEILWQRVRPLLIDAKRFRPPRVREIVDLLDVAEEEVRRLLKLMSRLGRAYEVAHDHFFTCDAVAEMVDIIDDLSQRIDGGQFTAAQFRDRIENGRKVAIQILEFFDRHGVTLRRGDLRHLNKHRSDLFRRIAEDMPACTAD